MKKKLFYLFLSLILSVIWLFPFQSGAHEWIMTAGFAASFICLCLIPQMYMAFASAAILTAGMCFYDFSYLAYFAPSVCCIAAVSAVSGGDDRVPLKKDVFLLTVLSLQSICFCFSLVCTFAVLRHIEFSFAVDRSMLWLCFAVCFSLFLFCRAVRTRENSPFLREKRIAVFFMIFLTLALLALSCLKHSSNLRVYTLPGLLCAASVFMMPNRLTDKVLRRTEP
ncbi:MAG: hypothetical protein J1E34_01590 [Oscillospiraceae bacterium]|nr:hypothetical protein [Oscillospiraceae bacterium]